VLTVESLSVAYGGLTALREVSLVVRAGQFVSIVGPNGAGKTTLFKAISGTVPPVTGRITFDGHDLLAVAPWQRAHFGIAHVPEGRQVFGSMTVMENLEMGGHPQSGRRDWERNLERIFALFPMLDEPSMGLAPMVADLIFERITQLHHNGLAILLVEQRVAEAVQSCDFGYVLETGRVVLEGDNQALLANDGIKSVYLGM
jgi:branched-chain amino acid transport system ATP-binding protein